MTSSAVVSSCPVVIASLLLLPFRDRGALRELPPLSCLEFLGKFDFGR
jgi:hypothetical protein